MNDPPLSQGAFWYVPKHFTMTMPDHPSYVQKVCYWPKHWWIWLTLKKHSCGATLMAVFKNASGDDGTYSKTGSHFDECRFLVHRYNYAFFKIIWFDLSMYPLIIHPLADYSEFSCLVSEKFWQVILRLASHAHINMYIIHFRHCLYSAISAVIFISMLKQFLIIWHSLYEFGQIVQLNFWYKLSR